MEDFSLLAKHYTPMIYSIIRKLSIYKDKEDYYQIGLIALWEAQKKYEPLRGTFHTYAYSVIKGYMLNELQKVRKYEMRTNVTDLTWIVENNSLSVCDLPLQYEDIICYCEKLTEAQRRWVIGTHIEHKTTSEIAKQYNVTISAVKSWKKSALQNLKKSIIQ